LQNTRRRRILLRASSRKASSTKEELLRKKPFLAIVPIAAAAIGLSVAGAAAGKTGPASADRLPSSSCSPIFYKGSGSPRYLIASDLPLQGAGRAQPLSMVKAIQYVLERQYKFKAGRFTVGYQSCDDATAQQGGWATEKCTANARAYANDRSVLGIVGTFNSGCAKLEIPILNRAPGGPVAMISPANTSVGLTHNAPWNDPGEPNIYYPTRVRNYARTATSDDYQGPFAADLIKKRLKINSVYILHDNQTFGKGVANAFRSRANKLDMDVTGFEPWDAKAASYEAIGERIKATGAKSVYLAGIVCNNGVKLIKDIGAVLGKGVRLTAPDGFTPYSATAGAGAAAQGMFISYAGVPLSLLGKKGKAFLKGFAKYQGRSVVDPYAVYAAQDAQILLDAIATSDGTRIGVVRRMFNSRVKDGIMGTFQFDRNGDICPFKTISFDRLVGSAGKFYSYVQVKASC
jgi:branched-chain amino acid transport system substrate-binding protein